MTDLVLGPLLRFVSETEATVFVETSSPCEVEILGRSEPTFRVEGHHYALKLRRAVDFDHWASFGDSFERLRDLLAEVAIGTRSTAASKPSSGPALAALAAVASGLARLAGAPDPGIRWCLLEGPCFDNQVASLRLDGREASMRLDRTIPDKNGEHALQPSFERRLT